MSSLKTVEKKRFEDLLGMSSGYVLDFTNQNFAALFSEAVRLDIMADRYARNGESKARRLRVFWEIEPDAVVGKVLSELLDMWSYKTPSPDISQQKNHDECRRVVQRLLGKTATATHTDDQFLKQDFGSVSIGVAYIDATVLAILNARFAEAQHCLKCDAPLAAIFLSGSILEGLLLGTATQHPQEFNQASCSPKDDAGKVKPFWHWTLAQLIDVAHETGFLGLDVRKFSHALRDFRNYIHPYQQMSSNFSPDKHTAEVCLQVLKAAVADLRKRETP